MVYVYWRHRILFVLETFNTSSRGCYFGSISLNCLYNTYIYSFAPVKSGSKLKRAIFEYMLRIKFMNSCRQIALKWMSQNIYADRSTIFQIMAWCHSAVSHNLSQFRSKPMPLSHKHTWIRTFSPTINCFGLSTNYIFSVLGGAN